MSKLLQACREVERTGEASRPVNTTTYINVERDLEGLADAVEAALPDAIANVKAIAKAQPDVLGNPNVVFAAICPSRRPRVTVTVYSTGSVSWSGTEPLFPVPEA